MSRQPYIVHTVPAKRRVLEAVKAGASYTHAAQQEGVPYATAVGWCKAEGITSQFPHGGAYRKGAS